MTLRAVEAWAYWGALGTVALCAIALWIPQVRSAAAKRTLAVAPLVLLSVSIVARWIQTAHPPIFGTFENTIACAWCMLAACIFLLGRRSTPTHEPALAPAAATWAAASLAYGLLFEATAYPLTISERNLLVDIHVLFAWGAFTVLLLTSTLALIAVLRPKERALDITPAIVRGTGVGFALFTAMMGVGAIYSYLLFAEWYRWEMVGTGTFVAWLGYGLVIHSNLLFGWKGKRLAWASIAMLPILLFVFWSWSLYSGTYHFFDLNAIRAF